MERKQGGRQVFENPLRPTQLPASESNTGSSIAQPIYVWRRPKISHSILQSTTSVGDGETEMSGYYEEPSTARLRGKLRHSRGTPESCMDGVHMKFKGGVHGHTEISEGCTQQIHVRHVAFVLVLTQDPVDKYSVWHSVLNVIQ